MTKKLEAHNQCPLHPTHITEEPATLASRYIGDRGEPAALALEYGKPEATHTNYQAQDVLRSTPKYSTENIACKLHTGGAKWPPKLNRTHNTQHINNAPHIIDSGLLPTLQLEAHCPQAPSNP